MAVRRQQIHISRVVRELHRLPYINRTFHPAHPLYKETGSCCCPRTLFPNIEDIADAVLVMKNGQIIENGKTDEILSGRHSLEELYMSHFGEDENA